MGAVHVTCIDFSEVMLNNARAKLSSAKNVSFISGDALHTSVEDQQFNVVLERAVVHHIKQEDLLTNLEEAKRILTYGGTLIIQDRTPEDCLQAGSQTHIRGYFFDRYPRLAQIEVARRHSNAVMMETLRKAGFRMIEKRQLWETRKLYGTIDSLVEDLRNRTDRSILHELNDSELADLIDYIKYQLSGDTQPIIEQDRWTIWSAIR